VDTSSMGSCTSGGLLRHFRSTVPMVRIVLSRPPSIQATYTRGPRGLRLVIRGPLEWLERPPTPGDVVRLLCCAEDTTLNTILAWVTEALSILAITLSLAPASLKALAVVAGLAALAGLVTAPAQLSRGRRVERCIESSKPGALARVALEPLARLVVDLIKVAGRCEGKCRVDTPLGRYRVVVKRIRASRIVVSGRLGV